MNAHTHAHAHIDLHACAYSHTHQSHIRAMRPKKKEKGFKEDLKELTEVEWRTETGSWFQITGAWQEKEL